MPDYFDPLRLGALELPNRLLMAPMTRSRAHGGLVDGHTAEYYAQRASAGLIITESTQPNVMGQGYIQTPGLHSAEQVAAWRAVTDAVHARGGRIFVQLMHSGRVGHPVLYPDGALPVAPSPIASGEKLFTNDGLLEHPVPREMTHDDIARTVDDFARAARNAIEAGFDGVELHGANGYLIHQFLADGANRRADSYGGPAANRIRFAVEVVRATVEQIGAHRTGLRVSPGLPANGVTESDTAELYSTLVATLPPLAYLHVMEFGVRDVTERLRKEWSGVLLLNPHPDPEATVRTSESGAAALGEGLADAITLGQEWLANPDLDVRIRAGGPFNEGDRATYYGGDHRGYTDYPTLDD
ncbi:alkene reductase [Halostreptopolyspora alba]|uniref:Alkene reductase n=1 Tax=Halostreptopolyspora alba TaxID=2487137 RepID=A0A3N0E2N7_9ACTN|nr:alkene reductase [Nocardiopsaceae bacterium YIM 96095]